MPVDVLTEILIDRPRGEVAAFTRDPATASDWYVNIESVEWRRAAMRRANRRISSD